MTTFSLLPLGLVLHISGIVVMVGTLFAGFLTNQQLWKCLPYDRERALTIVRATARYRVAGFLGGLVIVVNMLVLERPAGKRLRRMLYSDQEPVDYPALSAARRGLFLFYLLQLGLFVLIFVFSVYKFN
jgi:hypothetical protein